MKRRLKKGHCRATKTLLLVPLLQQGCVFEKICTDDEVCLEINVIELSLIRTHQMS